MSSTEEQKNLIQNFLSQPVNSRLRTVPGIGLSVLGKLAFANINTTDQLVGHFWLLERDEIKFIDFLEDIVGIQKRFAIVITENLKKKFGSL